VHPDYYQWRQERFDHPQYPWLIIPAGLVCVGLIFYLLILQSILIVAPIIFILALWAVSPLSFRLGTRGFREKWLEEHGAAGSVYNMRGAYLRIPLAQPSTAGLSPTCAGSTAIPLLNRLIQN
jgi:hypothetical protein